MLLLLVALQAAVARPTLTANEKQLMARYAACPGGAKSLAEGNRLSWAPGSPSIEAHQKFRTEMGASPPPEDGPRILWYASGGDLGTTTFSIVATRDEAGLWHIDGVGRSHSWAPGAPVETMPPIHRVASQEEGRSLDTLVADPCLEAQPTSISNPRILAGGMSNTLDVDALGHRWHGGWYGGASPMIDSITTILGMH